uniref:NADH dehydrogenase [ubiquinone] 1 alpha subcomplex subunit 1 n=1 Tax=Plectus sambesii TaxID=2011161 RepID=A0A914VNH8_9BILA
MWWETFYSGAITLAFITGFKWQSYVTNWIDTGHHHRRCYTQDDRTHMWKRDHRLTGNMYILKGLESLPDATE